MPVIELSTAAPILTSALIGTSVTNQLAHSNVSGIRKGWRKLWGNSYIGISECNLSDRREWLLILDYIHKYGPQFIGDSTILTYKIDVSETTSSILEFVIPTESFYLPMTGQITIDPWVGKPYSIPNYKFEVYVDPIVVGGRIHGFDFWTTRWGMFSYLSELETKIMLFDSLKQIRNIRNIQNVVNAKEGT
jgi:hypothetical protein